MYVCLCIQAFLAVHYPISSYSGSLLFRIYHINPPPHTVLHINATISLFSQLSGTTKGENWAPTFIILSSLRHGALYRPSSLRSEDYGTSLQAGRFRSACQSLCCMKTKKKGYIPYFLRASMEDWLNIPILPWGDWIRVGRAQFDVSIWL